MNAAAESKTSFCFSSLHHVSLVAFSPSAFLNSFAFNREISSVIKRATKYNWYLDRRIVFRRMKRFVAFPKPPQTLRYSNADIYARQIAGWQEEFAGNLKVRFSFSTTCESLKMNGRVNDGLKFHSNKILW